MPNRILHVLDATTPLDSLEMLAQILLNTPHEHRLVALGHRSTADLAAMAGIDAAQHPIQFVHSMGWADPSGWRSLRRVVRSFSPTHLHAWGVSAGVASVMTRFTGPRLMTLVDLPRTSHLQLLPFIHKGGLMFPAASCRWIVTSSWLKRELHSLAIGANDVLLVRPCINIQAEDSPVSEAALREELGIAASDGPIILLGGDGGMPANGALLARPGINPQPHGGRGGPRHDIGLWAATILLQVFPRLRAIVRDDPRGLPNHGLERLFNDLPEEGLIVMAPASRTWQELLSISDLLLVTPDGPMPPGSIVHALAAGVPVIGTPVDAVRELLTDPRHGRLAASNRPREIAAAIESFFNEQSGTLSRGPLPAADANPSSQMFDAIYAESPQATWQAA